MKFASSLLVVCSIVTLCSCETANTRRGMFAPKKGSGYWTTRSREGESAADASLKRTPARDYKPKAETTATSTTTTTTTAQ